MVASMYINNPRRAGYAHHSRVSSGTSPLAPSENIGTAGDSEVMNLNANSRVVVSVPADTKIYVVFTKHEQSPAELHKVVGTAQ